MPESNARHRREFDDALEAVRRRIVRERWGVAEGSLKAHEDLMLGHCHENVIDTCDALVARGYEPRFVWGAVNRGDERHTPETIAEAEQNGTVHFWTEVDVDGETFVLDPAAETDADRGSPLVTAELPEEYVRLPDSRFVYRMDVHARNLRNTEGYDDLVERGYLDRRR